MTAASKATLQAADSVDPYKLGRVSERHGQGGTHAELEVAAKRIIVGYGFWIFLLSDCVMFACFFAANAVLLGATAGGPGPAQVFDQRAIAIETAVLLLSSFTCGLSAVAANARSFMLTETSLAATGFLGMIFLAFEIHDFSALSAAGAGPTRSAYLSSFFTVVGCHGLHVATGLLWLGTMMAQVYFKGFRDAVLRRLLCFNLFWHLLDIIWVALFSIVYMIAGLSL